MDKTDHDLLIEIHGALMGINGQGGLMRAFRELETNHYRFKHQVLAVFFFILGSGLLGAGIWKLAGILP